MKRTDDEGGTFIVVAAVLCSLLLLTGLGLAKLGRATGDQARAQSAADAAALAGAYDIAHFDEDNACVSARETSVRNKAVVTSCHVSGYDIQVDVRLNNSDAHARARARAE